MLTLTALIQPSAETSSMCNKSRKVNKRHMDQKGRNKTVSEDSMLLYIENFSPKTCYKEYILLKVAE